MEAIVLAGGLGKRLRHIVTDLPKPMAPIAGRPFLEILLSNLANKGFKHTIISVGYLAHKITDYFGPKFMDMDLSYVIEDEPLGTGGAINLGMRQTKNDRVFIFNGDTFIDFDPLLVDKQWQVQNRPIIIGCEVDDTSRYGRLLHHNGIASGFTEKGISGPGTINAGCYVLHQKQLNLNSRFCGHYDF